MEEFLAYCGFALVVLAVFLSYLDLKSQVGRIERKVHLLLRHGGIDPSQSLPLSDNVKQLASDPARKIEAIKVHREETGANLKDAKDAVEAFINNK